MRPIVLFTSTLVTLTYCSLALCEPTTATTTAEAAPADANNLAPDVPSNEGGPSTARPAVSAPNEAEPNTAITANPLDLLFSLFNVDVGFGVAPKTSLNVSGNYWSFDLLGVKNTAWGLGVGTQYFFIGERFHGAFVYPALEYAHTTISIDDLSVSGSLYGPSAVVGYQWNWHPFTLRLGGGGRYYLGQVQSSGFKSDLQGFEFKFDGSIGFAF